MVWVILICSLHDIYRGNEVEFEYVLLYLYSVEGIVIAVINAMDLNKMVFSFN